MKKLILIFASLVFMVSCGQNKPIDEAPIDLQNVDFNRDFASFFPEKLRDKKYPNFTVYNVPRKNSEQTTSFQKDSLFINEYSEDKEFKGFETSQINWNKANYYATFGNLNFQKISLLSAPNDKLEAISAMADNLSNDEAGKYFAEIKNRLGNPTKLKNSWQEGATNYEWIKGGKLYRFVSNFNNESNTVKLVINEDDKKITYGEKEPHYQVYFFVVQQDIKKELLKKMHSGDFVYFRAEEDKE